MQLKKRTSSIPMPPKEVDRFENRVADLVVLFKGWNIMAVDFTVDNKARTPEDLGLEVAMKSEVEGVTIVEFKNSRKVQFYGPRGQLVYKVMTQYREDHKQV